MTNMFGAPEKLDAGNRSFTVGLEHCGSKAGKSVEIQGVGHCQCSINCERGRPVGRSPSVTSQDTIIRLP